VIALLENRYGRTLAATEELEPERHLCRPARRAHSRVLGSRALCDHQRERMMAIFISEKDGGFPAGELTCVAGSAAAEINRGGSFGHEQVEALPDDCEAPLRMSP
jgi:hypothetical protein